MNPLQQSLVQKLSKRANEPPFFPSLSIADDHRVFTYLRFDCLPEILKPRIWLILDSVVQNMVQVSIRKAIMS